ncbi:MAG TPA: DNA polymerase Y family protein, partial [Myxococcus sp.]|nr:DNA polymerase Y family protein [Myxococcus sp.]
TTPAWLDAEVAESGRLLAARLGGKRHRVTALAGPERLEGEWWSETPYQRDYYRVHFEGLGPAWVFRDGRDGRFYLQGLFD